MVPHQQTNLEISRASIPDNTIEVLARSIFKEAWDYGFGVVDYIRLVNKILDLCPGQSGKAGGPITDTGTRKCHAKPLYHREPAALPLAGAQTIVRTFNPALDLKLIKSWLHDGQSREFLFSCATPQPTDLEAMIVNPVNHFGIICVQDETPIGVLAFLDHSVDHRRAELRKLIGKPDARGHGFARDASKLWIQYGVSQLGIRKIYISTLQSNVRNIKLNEDLGFEVEGVLQNEIIVEGKPHDVLRMGLCIAQ